MAREPRVSETWLAHEAVNEDVAVALHDLAVARRCRVRDLGAGDAQALLELALRVRRRALEAAKTSESQVLAVAKPTPVRK